MISFQCQLSEYSDCDEFIFLQHFINWERAVPMIKLFAELRIDSALMRFSGGLIFLDGLSLLFDLRVFHLCIFDIEISLTIQFPYHWFGSFASQETFFTPNAVFSGTLVSQGIIFLQKYSATRNLQPWNNHSLLGLTVAYVKFAFVARTVIISDIRTGGNALVPDVTLSETADN